MGNKGEMPVLQVDNLRFTFLPHVIAERYDKWRYYAAVSAQQQKAVDVVAVENPIAPAVTWLIEAKDFRSPYPPKPSRIGRLAETVAMKMEHTIQGLEDVAIKAAIVSEKHHASIAVAAQTKRVVLHLEPHTGPHTALFPVGFAASVLQKLRQLVKATDPNPLVLNISNAPAAGVPWDVI